MNIPTDLFFLLIIRMDEEMLYTVLDEDETYMGMNESAFENFILQKMQHHKSLGDEKLLALPGKMIGSGDVAYAFMGNKSKEKMGIAVRVTPEKEMLSIESDEGFEFDEFPFDINSF